MKSPSFQDAKYAVNVCIVYFALDGRTAARDNLRGWAISFGESGLIHADYVNKKYGLGIKCDEKK